MQVEIGGFYLDLTTTSKTSLLFSDFAAQATVSKNCYNRMLAYCRTSRQPFCPKSEEIFHLSGHPGKIYLHPAKFTDAQ
ncbi:MAG: hypothetical protein ACLGSD_18080 [Acidobacteriota bacterium]